MAVNLSPVFGVAGQLFDNNGNPLAGGKIFTYLAGSTTLAATFTNVSGSIAHSNPIVLDGAGRVPSGEIWLTDGITYKFVVQDSANNLIGTYDNLTGINSNFVAFTNQQEIQTAAAGQTVFNLTTMQYQPGTNSLSVFVDGVNQYGPGAQYAYVETDSDTVTFVSGLHVGASVKFTTSQLNTSAAPDATQVSYTSSNGAATPTTVAAKLDYFVSRKDYSTDAAFTAVGTSPTAELAQIDFYSEGNSGRQLVPGPRGLSERPTMTNVNGALNSIPNGTPTGTNTAYSLVRAWGQDIIANPTGTRQCIEMDTHFGTDSILRGRLCTRSEGTPTVPHFDFYYQINGANCHYVGKKKDGTTGRTNYGIFGRGFDFVTSVTTYWSAGETVSIGATRLLTNTDFLYLECTTGGTTGGSQPTAGQVGDSVSDGTVTWVTKSKLYLAGSSPSTAAIPALWSDENGNVGFGTLSPLSLIHI